MRGPAYWISREGRVISVTTTHIAEVISTPEVFGTSLEEIHAVYTEHGEALGVEGEARVVILKDVLSRGWIRLRRHRDRWSIEADRLTPRTRAYIRSWARTILRRRIEEDRFVPVDVVGLSDGTRLRIELGTLATGKAFKVKGASRWRLRWPADRTT